MTEAARTEPRTVRVVTLGAAFSGNKGAASMLQAVIDNFSSEVAPCRIDALSIYPGEDRQTNPNPDVAIVSCKPRELLFPMFPIALLVAVLRACRIPYGPLCITPALRALRDADLVVDIAGISFVDGRGIPILGYNFLMTAVPLLMGKRVVKCSQALGPFRRPLNRLLARLILPRMQAVCARGERTETHLRDLRLNNVVSAADLAFTMKTPNAAKACAADILARRGPGDRPPVLVMPSSVVDRYCQAQGIDYAQATAAFVDRIIDAHGVDVLIAPHSSRPDDRPTRMNDLPVCRAAYAAVTRKDHCMLVEDDLSPAALRALIARSEMLVTSRFHAMISALATSTPVLVIGWSHKYEEVLRAFGLPECTVDYGALEADALDELFADLFGRRDAVRTQIADALPAVIDHARRNFDALREALR